MTQSTSAQAKVSSKSETAVSDLGKRGCSGKSETVSDLGFVPGGYTGDAPVDPEAHLRPALGELRGFLGDCGLLADQPAAEPSTAWIQKYRRDPEVRWAGSVLPWQERQALLSAGAATNLDFAFAMGLRSGGTSVQHSHLISDKIPLSTIQEYEHQTRALADLFIGKTVSAVVIIGHLGGMYLEFSDGSIVNIFASSYGDEEAGPTQSQCCFSAEFQEEKL